MTNIEKALEIACRYGQIDGSDHRLWVIDQMVRALLNCPIVKETAYDDRNEEYSYETQGESEEYLNFVREYEDGDYEWDCGISP